MLLFAPVQLSFNFPLLFERADFLIDESFLFLFEREIMSFLTKIFGSRNERILRRLRKQVAKINKMEPAFEALSDDELRAKTEEFRSRLANGETLQQLLPEAFATVREAGKRVLGMRHFDVQLIGGMVLTNRCIAEMRTGEGKTLTATLPCYLMALEGKVYTL